MVRFELSRLESCDDRSLLDELRRVAALVKSPTPTQSEFDRHSKASASVIRRRFAGWARALALAGLTERYSGTPEAKRILARGARTFTGVPSSAQVLRSPTVGKGIPRATTLKIYSRSGRITVVSPLTGRWTVLLLASLRAPTKQNGAVGVVRSKPFWTT